MHSTKKGDDIHITIGDHAQNVAAGKDIDQVVSGGSRGQVTEADLAAVRELFAELKRVIESQASPELKDPATERVEELEEAVTSTESDLTTMEYVKKWFGKNLPKLSGAVISVLVNPIVGKVAEAGGEIAAGELRRRFSQE